MDRKPMNNSTVNKVRLREVMTTEDGSFTLRIPGMEETYHSKHGAEQESRHVFIEQGLKFFDRPISILEVGMGTGLNVVLTATHAQYPIDYCALEPFPIEKNVVQEWLNHQQHSQSYYQLIHESTWDTQISIGQLNFIKHQEGLMNWETKRQFDLIYFDAFGPTVEPTLWELEVMQKCFDLLNPAGVWVSYCAKGQVRRNLQAVGFTVKRLPGPPGKREMLFAQKPA
jgi:tRNA U34 5-methylaminomethyl-2-thiouridine-forming methyltransferase MnmC